MHVLGWNWWSNILLSEHFYWCDSVCYGVFFTTLYWPGLAQFGTVRQPNTAGFGISITLGFPLERCVFNWSVRLSLTFLSWVDDTTTLNTPIAYKFYIIAKHKIGLTCLRRIDYIWVVSVRLTWWYIFKCLALLWISLLYRQWYIVVSLSSDKCTCCKFLWINASAKRPKCKC